jgi:hypothetical protein
VTAGSHELTDYSGCKLYRFLCADRQSAAVQEEDRSFLGGHICTKRSCPKICLDGYDDPAFALISEDPPPTRSVSDLQPFGLYDELVLKHLYRGHERLRLYV